MKRKIKILYASSFWFGSDDCGMRNALHRRADVTIDEIDADHYVSTRGDRILQVAYRLIRRKQQHLYNETIIDRVKSRPIDVFFVSKGNYIYPETLDKIKKMGVLIACFYPDKSPKAYGVDHDRAMGLFDVVFSSKSFHPEIWQSEYGYQNECIHVSHGYDKAVHLAETPASAPTHDIVMVANARPIYTKLIQELMNCPRAEEWSVAIGGARWAKYLPERPSRWTLVGEQNGRAYTSWLRRGKVVLAPVENEYELNGKPVHADQVTARTFQIPAAYNFFIHTDSDEARDIFSGRHEIPLFKGATDLHDLISDHLKDDRARKHYCEASRDRGVPEFSLDVRAAQIVDSLRTHLGT